MSKSGKVKQKAKQQVGRRRVLKGSDVHTGRLVIATVSGNEVEAVEHIMEEHGHNARSGAIRCALRLLAKAKRGEPDSERMATAVRREASFYNPKAPSKVRVPVNLDPQDSDLLEQLKDRWELDSFAQVVRLALRRADKQYSLKN
jgi:hypothetical protein